MADIDADNLCRGLDKEGTEETDNSDVTCANIESGAIGAPTIGVGKSAPFKAIFNGNGKTIRNLYMNYDGYDASDMIGLFGVLGAGAEVRNLTIETRDRWRKPNRRFGRLEQRGDCAKCSYYRRYCERQRQSGGRRSWSERTV